MYISSSVESVFVNDIQAYQLIEYNNIADIT